MNTLANHVSAARDMNIMCYMTDDVVLAGLRVHIYLLLDIFALI